MSSADTPTAPPSDPTASAEAAAPGGLKRAEAVARAALLDVESYDLRLDLASDTETFGSVTTVRFTSRGGTTFVDLKPASLRSVHLDGHPVDVDLLRRGRLPLETTEGPHELVVDAVMAFRNDGEGLHRSVDPADGRHYVYGMSFMDAAPSVFACFDQPDLKAPYTLHVTAPEDWVVIGNAPATNPEPGVWELEASQPLSTYFVTLVAGPYHLVRDQHDGIPLGLSARASLAADLDADAEELLTMTKQCFDEFHRLFGIRYPFGDYHQAFVPEFNAGAMENPGCVTFRDQLVFSSKVTRGQRIQRATTVAHEMAHQWFGNITTPLWWDDLWLNESFAEYMGNRVTADVTEYTDAWVYNSFSRRQWGLLADQRPSTHPVAGNGEEDATAALQNFDGISYAKGSSILKQLNATMGDEVFLAGAVDHFRSHFFGNATMHDLFASWERAGAGDLSDFTRGWLVTAGPDRIVLDRAAGALVRTPPPGSPADRSHTFRVATARATDPAGGTAGTGPWALTRVTTRGGRTAYEPEAGAAVVLDPYDDTWAVVEPDAETLAQLPALLPRTDDALLRAGVWNGVRSGYHHAAVAPAAVVDLVEAWLPTEDSDAAIAFTVPWLLRDVLPLTTDGDDAAARVHEAGLAGALAAPAGSTLQLAAFQAAAATAPADRLEHWIAGEGLPDGVEVDDELRWRLLVRLAALGATDRSALDRWLAQEPTTRTRVEHARAVASLPEAAAKEFAWERFTGAVPATNYELEAAGLGLWRPGQEHLTEPYVDRYLQALPTIAEVHQGWVLGQVVTAFFPLTSLRDETVAALHAAADAPGLDATVRRRVVDATDDLEHRLAVARAFGA
ncbi:aminopeptidase N [Nocardioides kribbensis]|uniref:aminopeptidase N n=1 Tax=Nocardioides kribbensis TaxID=305517 RepID=UPI0032DA9ECB